MNHDTTFSLNFSNNFTYFYFVILLTIIPIPLIVFVPFFINSANGCLSDILYSTLLFIYIEKLKYEKIC